MSAPIADVNGKRLVLVCGSGGVGKTTTSAALGVAIARSGLRVLVITVDPARRLAQALGLEEIGTEQAPVSVDGGTMHIAMLDTKAGWDELVRRHARDEATANRIIANPLYHNITARFVNSHDYIAMEKLHELGASGDFDVVVVDTPPSRNALDLLDAPTRMREFFGGRLLRWLTLPYRSRALTIASRPFLQIADRILGAQFLSDIAEFFTLLQSMEAGFVRRAGDVERTLRSGETACIVVTGGESASGNEAIHLIRELRNRAMHPVMVVVNKTFPVGTMDDTDVVATDVVDRLVAAGAGDVERVRSAMLAMTDAIARAEPVRAREREVIDALARERVHVVAVPLSSAPRGSDPWASSGVSVIVSSLTTP